MVEEQLATTTDSRGISASERPASLSLGLTVAELQLGALRRRPDATALVCEGRRYTYRQMEERVSQVAQLFASKGLGTRRRRRRARRQPSRSHIRQLGRSIARHALHPPSP
jgi:non-ribosomal peptide synthetase component F